MAFLAEAPVAAAPPPWPGFFNPESETPLPLAVAAARLPVAPLLPLLSLSAADVEAKGELVGRADSDAGDGFGAPAAAPVSAALLLLLLLPATGLSVSRLRVDTCGRRAQQHTRRYTYVSVKAASGHLR